MTIFRPVLFLLVLSVSMTSMAASMRSTSIGNGTELRLSAGTLKGEASLIYYDVDGSSYGIPGYKVEEYDWKLDSVPMAGIGVTTSVNNSILLNFDYWANAADGEGTADYYMWDFPGYDWSDRTHHPDTTVRKAELIDVSAEYLFSSYGSHKDQSSWSAIVGYRRDFFDWRASGGDGVWSNPGYRDTYVLFADVPLFKYQQTFNLPYLGLVYRSITHSGGGRYETRFVMEYSAWVKGEDELVNLMGNMKYEADASNGEWYKFGLEMDFDLTRQMMLTIGYSVQGYYEMKGTWLATNLATSATTKYPDDSAGISNRADLLTIGINYRF